MRISALMRWNILSYIDIRCATSDRKWFVFTSLLMTAVNIVQEDDDIVFRICIEMTSNRFIMS